jgi:O-antigen/teichoic acid export membrane protein
MNRVASSSVSKSSAFLGSAGLVEYSLQLILPIILVRTLTPDAFGDYRLFWLLAGTAATVFTFSLPHSLFHFLPQAEPRDKPRLIGNAWLFLSVSGLLAAVLLYLTWSWLPPAVQELQRYSILAPVFVMLWVMGCLMDVLPTADGNARWHALAIVTMALVRTIALGLTAILTQDGMMVLIMVCVFAMVRSLLVPLYAFRSASVRGLAVKPTLLGTQVRYAFPFAVGQGLFMLRVQADQWVVASFFDSSVFALISIAAMVLGVSTLVRMPVNSATLPKLSHYLGQNLLQDARDLQSRAFSALSLVLLPTLGLALVLANELVEIVYTPTYIGAALLMQIYLVGQMVSVFATGHLLMILNEGRTAMLISAVCLVLSVALSVGGVYLLGLPGAVAGSVVSLLVGEAWCLRVVARRLGTGVTALINLSIVGRSALIVLVAILSALAVRHYLLLDQGPWIRLAITGLAFSAPLFAGSFALGIQRHFVVLFHGLRREPGGNRPLKVLE